MKKISELLICGLMLVGCANTPQTTDAPKEGLTLDIVVENKETNEVIFDGECTSETKGSTLADFLEGADELEVEMEDGTYGKTIISILGVKTEDWNKGPWWTYTSETNETCKEEGFCPAASDLEVEDGDSFVFTYSSEF